jgi:hypothetical protein
VYSFDAATDWILVRLLWFYGGSLVVAFLSGALAASALWWYYS